MEPIAILMIEHRLIERMLKVIAAQAERIRMTGNADLAVVAASIDFIRGYIDECHHGKEEDVLFAALSRKPLEPEYVKLQDELVREHDYARTILQNLEGYYRKYAGGDPAAARGVEECLAELASFYPRHIEKEDRHFFLPAMECLSRDEQIGMVERSRQYDSNLIHDRYRGIVTRLEQEREVTVTAHA